MGILRDTVARVPRPYHDAYGGPLPGAGCTLLVVDDHDDTRDALTRLFEQDGYHVLPFASGREALDAVHRLGHPPDVAILDMAMPSMDGFALRDALRKHETLRDVPIIALTGRPVLQAHALKTGFAAALLKPCDSNVLRSLVAHHCKTRNRATNRTVGK